MRETTLSEMMDKKPEKVIELAVKLSLIHICIQRQEKDTERISWRKGGIKMKNIYELMNEIKTDTEEYPQEEFSEFEAKKWNKKLSKELKRPRRLSLIHI